ncbi:cell envelope integrity protein TolA [Pontibaca salina]|uniref:Energy transducer TonB n=1 Tax=Pontibaca salina TaxID=2795731 RepID=A0A934M1C6_9RHOB|nr:TonB family protein [Pontibaca salina]MBI6630910.1 energy transducer TonB [Pontibaca salina]
MIPGSRYVALICLALAGALHAAIAVLPSIGAEKIALQGGGGASISTSGDSFADMAEGASVPKPEPTMHVELTAAAAPSAAHSAAPSDAATAAPVATQKSPAPTVASAQPVEQISALSPERADRIQAETHAPKDSARPEARPERPKLQPKRKAASKTAPPPRQAGNAKSTARAGDASGKETAQTQQAGPAQHVTARSGNAAAENYPGQVMRQIQRTRRERVNARGSVQVSFTIAANGGLAALNIVGSSGSEQLDRVALQQIRRAAPFPAPPQGARRDFTLRIDGR